jgi:5-methylcytosine-specific restriction endonuclease McrA
LPNIAQKELKLRKLSKKQIPQILQDNAEDWTAEFKADPTNKTKKFRYRHKDIKNCLKEETENKCIYCESKIGHNTPGDVEHKIPTDINKDMHFDWENLTIACGECNRRKLAYYSVTAPFLDPYNDKVEQRLKHLGPIVSWSPGDASAEISVRTLALHDYSRKELINRKIEHIDILNNTIARMKVETGILKKLMELSVEKMKEKDAEYSAMICAICETYGV